MSQQILDVLELDKGASQDNLEAIRKNFFTLQGLTLGKGVNILVAENKTGMPAATSSYVTPAGYKWSVRTSGGKLFFYAGLRLIPVTNTVVVRLLVDGEEVTQSTTASTDVYVPIFWAMELGAGTHVLEIQQKGLSGSAAAATNAIVIAEFII